jgi:hypothetical protein
VNFKRVAGLMLSNVLPVMRLNMSVAMALLKVLERSLYQQCPCYRQRKGNRQKSKSADMWAGALLWVARATHDAHVDSSPSQNPELLTGFMSGYQQQ